MAVYATVLYRHGSRIDRPGNNYEFGKGERRAHKVGNTLVTTEIS